MKAAAKPSTPLVIIGAGGHGVEVSAYATGMGVNLGGVFDDHRPPGPWQLTHILGGLVDLPEFCSSHENVVYMTALGDNAVRRRVVRAIAALNIPNLTASSLIHPSAWLGPNVTIADGTLIAPGAILTAQVRIGSHCIMNIQSSASHDCTVGDWCNINPSATLCGNVTVGEGCYVGAGATVLEKRTIGAWTIIGAGAVVVEDLPSGVTAAGVPARIIKRQGVPHE
ncbi:acetyltransferase [Ramlibacter sp. WS9]|uniref:acetyltransferase n=1 Tax=Ramlibacter sp. WS9 TaxID=1882741 RepID=UPI0011444D74|nr:acetyltransferase [Ramlibacter sp. WS9]ROZ66361.1 acetyltransferase [Ramlibacter sp. WS9]